LDQFHLAGPVGALNHDAFVGKKETLPLFPSLTSV
jgi:hypothetical protein